MTQQIPDNIQEKLDHLPIIPFDDQENLQRLLMSDGFDEIFQFYLQNYGNDKLKSQSEVYQKVSLYLALTNQSESFLEQADSVLYIRPVPTIEQFLDDNYYMGLQNGTLYPYWRKKLLEIFDPNSITKRVLWGGSTGTGKTTIARKAAIYSLYKLLCLKYPRAVLNVDEGSPLALFILSVTQKNAYQTNFEPFLNILSNMPCFQKVRNMASFENFDISNPKCPIPFYVDKANLTINFINGFLLTLGSNIANTVGYNIVISLCDEVNEKGVEEGMELLNSIDGRLDSRFKGSEFTFQHVISSARSTESVTREYAKKWSHDPTFLYLKPMRFEVKQSSDFVGDGTTFPVFVGNGVIPNRIVTDPGELEQIEKNEFEIPSGCEIVKVPSIYKEIFKADLDQQIQDTLGIDTQDQNFVFRDTSRLTDTSLIPELHFEANLNENVKLIDLLPKDMFINTITGKTQIKRAASAPRYIHLDLATSGNQCDTGLCMLHKEYKMDEITNEKVTMFVVDFICWINAKTKTNIEAIQKFCMDLVLEKHIPIASISADQYQSALILQQWERSNCFGKVEKVSVDTSLDPYMNAATQIETGRIKVGQCNKLIRELEALILNNGKVTRTTELKDMADALVGAIYCAQKNYKDVPVYLYEEHKEEMSTNKEINYYDLIGDNETLCTI